MAALKVWNGTAWVYAKSYSASATVSATAPTSPTLGKQWFDTTTSELKIWDGSTWQAKYSASGQGTWVGPWGGSPPPNGTTGVTFTIQQVGYYRFTADGSGYSSPSGGHHTMAFFIDGVNKGQRSFYINQVSTHIPWPRVTWTALMTAGTHYFYVQFTAASDAEDSACLSWDLI